jgi:hypothetical protein
MTMNKNKKKSNFYFNLNTFPGIFLNLINIF